MLKPPDQLTWKSCSMLMQFCNVFIVDVEPDFTLIGGLFGSETVDQNCSFFILCFTQFGTICTIYKTLKIPMEECYF